jgi:hypothetical protein
MKFVSREVVLSGMRERNMNNNGRCEAGVCWLYTEKLIGESLEESPRAGERPSANGVQVITAKSVRICMRERKLAKRAVPLGSPPFACPSHERQSKLAINAPGNERINIPLHQFRTKGREKLRETLRKLLIQLVQPNQKKTIAVRSNLNRTTPSDKSIPSGVFGDSVIAGMSWRVWPGAPGAPGADERGVQQMWMILFGNQPPPCGAKESSKEALKEAPKNFSQTSS